MKNRLFLIIIRFLKVWTIYALLRKTPAIHVKHGFNYSLK